MRITPLDIRKQEFKKSMRGLDTDEVYAFLTTVAQEYENVLNDNKQLREHIVDLQERLKEFKNMENNLRDTLLTAEKLTADARENARHEADLIIKEAEIEAEKASQRVRVEAERLRNEVMELRKQKENYIVRFKTLIDTHRQMILNSETDFDFPEPESGQAGWKSESHTQEMDPHHRMSRERITEEFSHDPEEGKSITPEPSSVDDPARMTQKPQTDQPDAGQQEAGKESIPAPEMKTPEKGAEQDPSVQEIEVQREDNKDSDAVDQWVDTVSSGEEDAPAVRPEEKGDQWKEYDVKGEEPDWNSYEISEGERGPEEAGSEEVNQALSGLQEHHPGQERRESPEMDEQKDERVKGGAEDNAEERTADEQGKESAWSLEEFRKNLTNISDDN